MPDQITDNILSRPTRSYNIDLIISKDSYANDLRRVRIINSLNSAYPIIILSISLDANDIILKKIYGKEPMKLIIKLLTRETKDIPKEKIEMDLMYFKSSSTIPMKTTLSQEKMKDRTIVNLITVPIKAFNTVTSLVNDVYTGMSPIEMIQDLANKVKCELVYDKDGINTLKVPQVLIPPTTFYKTIRYIEDNFSIYDAGTSSLGYCQYTNKFYIHNLTSKMKKTPIINVTHLAMDAKDIKQVMDKCREKPGEYFYTYSPIKSSYDCNSKFAGLSRHVNVVSKPTDALYLPGYFDLNEECASGGLIDKSSVLELSKEMDNRETFIIDETGGYPDGVYCISAIMRKILDFSEVSFNLEKDLRISRLFNIGESVKLTTQTLEYIPISGKYIMKSSDINFVRDVNHWEVLANVNMMRTNKLNPIGHDESMSVPSVPSISKMSISKQKMMVSKLKLNALTSASQLSGAINSAKSKASSVTSGIKGKF